MDMEPHIKLRRWSPGQTFAALQYPNYRLWFMGQLASLVGTWMQSTAQSFLIYQLTQSPAYLGLIGFAGGLPTWLFMLYAGVVADRVSRRKLLIITQVAMMVLAFVLAGITLAGWVRPWHILVLAFLLGIANAFDAPARQAFVLEMVDREDLGNAIALNSAMFNSAAAVGPAIAGLTYATLGPVWCFAINGVSFIAVILALAAMRLEPFQAPPRTTSQLELLKEGLRFVAGHTIIRGLVMLVGISVLFGAGYITLFPAWAVNILHGNSATNGYLQSARGFGALAAALLIASLGRFKFKGKLLVVGALAFPIFVMAFSQVRILPLSLILVVGAGWGSMLMFNLTNTLVQTHVPDALRGRVMSLYAMIFFGAMPMSALLAGTLAERIGLPETALLGAVVALVAAAIILMVVPQMRRLE